MMHSSSPSLGIIYQPREFIRQIPCQGYLKMLRERERKLVSHERFSVSLAFPNEVDDATRREVVAFREKTHNFWVFELRGLFAVIKKEKLLSVSFWASVDHNERRGRARARWYAAFATIYNFSKKLRRQNRRRLEHELDLEPLCANFLGREVLIKELLAESVPGAEIFPAARQKTTRKIPSLGLHFATHGGLPADSDDLEFPLRVASAEPYAEKLGILEGLALLRIDGVLVHHLQGAKKIYDPKTNVVNKHLLKDLLTENSTKLTFGTPLESVAWRWGAIFENMLPPEFLSTDVVYSSEKERVRSIMHPQRYDNKTMELPKASEEGRSKPRVRFRSSRVPAAAEVDAGSVRRAQTAAPLLATAWSQSRGAERQSRDGHRQSAAEGRAPPHEVHAHHESKLTKAQEREVQTVAAVMEAFAETDGVDFGSDAELSSSRETTESEGPPESSTKEFGGVSVRGSVMVDYTSEMYHTRILACYPIVEAGKSVATTVILDNFTRSVVISFRGTTDPEDAFTDLADLRDFVALNPEEPEETVYGSLKKCADDFIQTADAGKIWDLFPPDFMIVCTGHSLGASVTVVAGLILRRKFPEWKNRIRCLCVAPMGCCCSASLIPETRSFVVG